MSPNFHTLSLLTFSRQICTFAHQIENHHHHILCPTLFFVDNHAAGNRQLSQIKCCSDPHQRKPAPVPGPPEEYVEGMQRKLQDFETKGVAATLEMQQAARDVAIENSRLKMLLAHNGIGMDAVESFLQSFKGQDAAEAEQYAAKIATAESIASLGRASTVATLFPEHAHIDKLAVLASASMQQQSGSASNGHDSDTTITSDDSTTGPSTGPVTPSSSHMNAPSPSEVDFSSEAPQTMSCDAAAHIIAQMQGCGFREQASKGGHLEGGQNGDYLIQNSAFLKILEAASIFN